jgi:sarcosine oxidase delta subunit
MGMFNRVYARCPECGKRGEMQIHQIVLGFGDFNIDHPEDLARALDEDKLVELHAAILGEDFVCTGYEDWGEPGCGHVFNPIKPSVNDRIDLARKLFERNDE